MCLNTYMKSFTRVKIINGKEYLYEITPISDDELLPSLFADPEYAINQRKD